MARYAVIDVETTGGTARFERITEIAVVLHDGAQVLDTFSTLINPERSIPWNITQITGITDEMVAQAPRFFEVARRIVELTEGAVFVAHNVQFDYSFLREEFARLGFSYQRKQLCTVRLSRQAFPGLPSYSLSNLKRHFGIEAKRSHRALDDALATVRLFERVLATQNGAENIKDLVNQGIKEAKLPPGITLERLEALPETCGVYYLHDDRGAVIYVGKSINIRKRVCEHFADATPKGEKLRAGVADISYEETGSELVALLLESAEIKRYQPRINRALRVKAFNACIFAYTDQRGYRCLAIGKRTTKNAGQLEIVSEYPKLDHARTHLQSLARQFELCEKLCNLDFREQACFYHSIKKCQGACIGQEPPESYNERVELAAQHLHRGLEGSFLVVDRGRHDAEHALIGVREGAFCGYIFVEQTELSGLYPQELLNDLQPPGPDPDAARIIRGFLESKKGARTIPVKP